MFDPELNKTFDHLTSGSDVLAWYGQNSGIEPIWTTNQKAGGGRKSAAEWIGANALFSNQAITTLQYNHSTPFTELIDRFIDMFTSEHDPINFGAIYFDQPDYTGHLYGPDSNEMDQELQNVDKTLGYLIEQLKSHHLFDKLNLIVTSDHGMTSISNRTAIDIDEYLDANTVSMYGSGVVKTVFLIQSRRFVTLGLVFARFKLSFNFSVFFFR